MNIGILKELEKLA